MWILNVFIIVYILLNTMLMCFVHDESWDIIPELINPIVMYKRKKVNYFGCFVLTLVSHILFAPFAIGYWLYKLCTIGRR